MEPDVTGKCSWLTFAGKGKGEQPGALARGHFLWGPLCPHLLESEGVQGSRHHRHSSRARAEHFRLNTTRFEDSMNKMLLITSGKKRTNTTVPSPRAGWGGHPRAEESPQPAMWPSRRAGRSPRKGKQEEEGSGFSFLQ